MKSVLSQMAVVALQEIRDAAAELSDGIGAKGYDVEDFSVIGQLGAIAQALSAARDKMRVELAKSNLKADGVNVDGVKHE